MGSGILGIGASALNAAQVGVTVTGHNISNASTPGYTRQVVTQAAIAGENKGYGFVGKGTQIASVTRVYNEFLGKQVLNTQTSQSQLSTYSTQIKQIDNVLADQSAGLSPALQDFFASVQTLTSDSNSAASRQALLSSGESLSARFQGLANQLNESRQAVNGQITASLTDINVYATQIANLNDSIEKLQAGTSSAPNDLLDQRDQAVSELSKQLKVSVVKQGDSYNVFVGNGQPLVIGGKASTLIATTSLTDSGRVEISARSSTGAVTELAEANFTGGVIGGLLDFRAKTLDPAQNTLGRVAINLSELFNAQHKLGQTQTGALGSNFFSSGTPLSTPSSANTGTGIVSASITNASALTISDYQLENISATATPSYRLTRLSDGTTSLFAAAAAPATSTSVTVDGVSFTISGAPNSNDTFLIRPVFTGAANFKVAISDPKDIALGASVVAAATSTNKGTGVVGAPAVSATTVIPAGLALTYAGTTLSGIPSNLPVTVTDLATPPVTRSYAAGAPVTYNGGETITFGGVSAVIGTATTPPPASFTLPAPTGTLTYTAASASLSGFPALTNVTVTANGASTTYAPGVAVPYTNGATISYSGISFTLRGALADGDTFNVTANVNGQGDNRNALLLAKLQTTNTLDGGTTTFQGAYSKLVSAVGNKAHELDATSTAATSLLAQSIANQQSESGVNLDEEAANLLRYQQAYQAAGKLLQTVGTLFDTLLSIGK
jgi:flagellar hook-associated protein 1 FlgK